MVRVLTYAFLVATVALISGCGNQPVVSAPPERPVLTASSDPGVAYVAVIGDVYTSGSPSDGRQPSDGEGANGWPALATKMLRDQGVNISAAVGARSGSGYAGHRDPRSVPFIDQVRRVVGTKDQLVILFGSIHDQANPPDQLVPLVQGAFAEVKERAPHAKLLVIGPAWMQSDPPLGLLQTRDVIQSQALAVGATFVDPITERWFIDRPDMLGAHDNRPNDAGHAFMAEKIGPLIAQQLQTASP